MQIKVKSTWATEVNFGEIFDGIDDINLINRAHDAMNKFYRKEKKRRAASNKKSKMCWQ